MYLWSNSAVLTIHRRFLLFCWIFVQPLKFSIAFLALLMCLYSFSSVCVMMTKHGGLMHEKYNAKEPEKGPGAGGEYTPQVGEGEFAIGSSSIVM